MLAQKPTSLYPTFSFNSMILIAGWSHFVATIDNQIVSSPASSHFFSSPEHTIARIHLGKGYANNFTHLTLCFTASSFETLKK